MHSSPHWKDTLTSRQMDHTDPRHRLHAPDTPDDTQKDAPHSLAHKRKPRNYTPFIHYARAPHSPRSFYGQCYYNTGLLLCCSLLLLSTSARRPLWITDRAHSSAAAAAAADHTATHTTHCMRAAAGASPLLLPPSPLLPSNPPLSFLSDEPEPLSFTQSLSPAHLSCHHIIQLRRRPSNHEPRTLIGRSSSPASPLAPSPPNRTPFSPKCCTNPSPHLLNRTTTNPYTQEEERKKALPPWRAPPLL